MNVVNAESVPVIVVGRGPTALGILRSLTQVGIPAFVACPPDDLVTRSRWYRPTPGRRWDGQLGEAGLAALAAMPLQRAVVVAGADDVAMWLADLPPYLSERFRVSTSSRDVQALLQDKSTFAGYLSAAGIPHPRTYLLECLADVASVPMDVMDRVFIKPVNSQRFSDVHGAKGMWVHNRTELRDTWARLHAQGFSVMAQEYIPGPPTEHFFIDGFRDASGAYPGLFARQRMRMSPPDFGNSSCSMSVPLKDVADPVRHVRRLLDGVDYRGIFSAEFKRDQRDGSFRIIEVNTRAWTYVEFAARQGVNVCDMAWRDALGQPVPSASTDYAPGKLCVDLYHDLACARRKQAWSIASAARLAVEWGKADLHVFRLDDPRPALYVLKGMVRKQLARRHHAPEAAPSASAR